MFCNLKKWFGKFSYSTSDAELRISCGRRSPMPLLLLLQPVAVVWLYRCRQSLMSAAACYFCWALLGYIVGHCCCCCYRSLSLLAYIRSLSPIADVNCAVAFLLLICRCLLITVAGRWRLLILLQFMSPNGLHLLLKSVAVADVAGR